MVANAVLFVPPCPSRWALLRHRTRSVPASSRTRPRPRRAAAFACTSFDALERDIRDYLATCDGSLPGSPLAYVNLSKAGRADLVSRIMEQGGYIPVSKKLGIPVDDSAFRASASPPVPRPVFANRDLSARVALGSALEDRLDTAADMPSSSVTVGGEGAQRFFSSLSRPVPSGEQLAARNRNVAVPIVDAVVAEGELLSLSAGMRLSLIALAALWAIGFGHASTGVVGAQAVNISKGVASGLSVAHFALGVYAGALVAPKLRRSAPLWFVKVLLSGPVGLSALKALGPIGEE